MSLASVWARKRPGNVLSGVGAAIGGIAHPRGSGREPAGLHAGSAGPPGADAGVLRRLRRELRERLEQRWWEQRRQQREQFEQWRQDRLEQRWDRLEQWEQDRLERR